MPAKINKLQIRATVLDMISSYNSDDDFRSGLHISNINTLNKIEDKKFVCEILLKELIAAENIKLDAIKNLLIDFATLEMVEDSIWQFLQDENIADSKKEIFLQLLRAFGGKVDVNMLMNCMSDFGSVVDEQTLGLLELATVNPEAQIDFMDFLTSLHPDEQLQLISSLNEDFKGNELANILSPALRINLKQKVKEKIISILGDSSSYLAVKPLKLFLSANENKELKPMALKALNQLKKNNIDIDDDEVINLREKEICKLSKFYKAFLSQVDGCGNQGLIFSRITDDKKVIMFSVVLNITGGIMDCFGLYLISMNDFQKVVRRFKENDFVVPIDDKTAKFKLEQAEKINHETGSSIPYEYSCWSVHTCDIDAKEIDYNALIKNEISNFDNSQFDILYDTEVFDTWFFEYDDNREVQNFLDYIISIHDKNIDELFEDIENKIEDIYYKIYIPDKIDEYSQMLSDAAHVFAINYDYEKSNIAANLATAIKNGETRFLKDVIRRSVLQYLANIVAENAENHIKPQNIFTAKKNKKKITSESAFELLQKLEEKWDNLEDAK